MCLLNKLEGFNAPQNNSDDLYFLLYMGYDLYRPKSNF